MSREQKIDLLERLNEYDKRLKYNKLSQWFPTEGPYRRALYPKACEFFAAGKNFRERVIFGANRSGKSTANNFEVALHATGLYPDWWEGKRFEDNVEDLIIWCSGDSHESVRNIGQKQLIGNFHNPGTGMIPKSSIIHTSNKSGVHDAFESVVCKRPQGNLGTIYFKAYTQGRKAYQGDAVHVNSMDEEPPDPYIYSEAFTRTMTTDGTNILSFTPLDGITPVVDRFLPYGDFPEDKVVPPTKEDPHISRWITQILWDDAPHLSQKDKDEMWSGYMPWEREARSTGRPAIGSGKIYTVPECDFVIEPFSISWTWPKVYGLDFALFGGSTACVWAAYDSDNDIIYVYDVYKASAQPPAMHAEAIRRRGSWIPGVIDPSAVKRNDEGKEWLLVYQDLGLNIELAKNAVDPGIAEITNRLNDGRLRIFNTCTPLLQEYRTYRLDKNLKVAKNQKDDLLDALRYLVMSGLSRAMSLKDYEEENSPNKYTHVLQDRSRSDVTGF